MALAFVVNDLNTKINNNKDDLKSLDTDVSTLNGNMEDFSGDQTNICKSVSVTVQYHKYLNKNYNKIVLRKTSNITDILLQLDSVVSQGDPATVDAAGVKAILDKLVAVATPTCS